MTDAVDDILAGHDFAVLNRLQAVRDVRRNVRALTAGQLGHVVTDRHSNSTPQDEDDLLVRVCVRSGAFTSLVLENPNFHVIAGHERPKRCRVLGRDEFLRDILELVKAHEFSFSLS
jgi:hypothetical protein